MTTWTKETVDLAIATDSLTVDNIKIDGSNIGHTDDTDLLALASGTLTVNGAITATGLGTLSSLATSGDATVGGNLTVTGGKLTFGNGEMVNNESDNVLYLRAQNLFLDSNTGGYGNATIGSMAEASNDSKFALYDGGSIRWSMGQDQSDSAKLKFDYATATVGAATKLTLDGSGNATLAGNLTLSATQKLYLDGGTHTYFHESSNDVVQLAGGVDQTSAVRLINMTPKSGAGAGNTVYGQDAGSNLDSASTSNTYFGAKAGDATHSNADGNTGMGYIALSKLTTGNGNAAFGNGSLYEMTEGLYNTALGTNAMDADTKGTKSVAVGYNALTVQNFDGVVNSGDVEGRNVAIGFGAGGGVTSGTKNVLIGYLAGDNITTGKENIVIGHNAEISAVGTDNEIVIGSDATGLGANKIVLGDATHTDVYMAEDSGASVHCTSVTLKETTTPTALADHGKVYTKNDNKLYFQDGAGTEHEIQFV